MYCVVGALSIFKLQLGNAGHLYRHHHLFEVP